MSRRLPHGMLSALPPYLGGKRKLLPWIFTTLSDCVPPEIWPELRFVDAFMGGGAVSLYAKAQGFGQLTVNDWSARSAVIQRGLIQNHRIRLTGEDVYRAIHEGQQQSTCWATQHVSPSIFARPHARALDAIFSGALTFQSPVKRALVQLLGWHLMHQFVAIPSTITTGNRPFAEFLEGSRHWDTLNPKRFQDGSLAKLCQPTWYQGATLCRRINRGVIAGGEVTVSQEDALTWLPSVDGDVVYLDPPYPQTTSYERSQRVIDALIAQTPSDTQTSTPSPFSQGLGALHDLLDRVRHIPVWILSYGDHCVTLSELIDVVKSHAGFRTVTGFSRAYGHMSHVSKRAHNQELLVVAYGGTCHG